MLSLSSASYDSNITSDQSGNLNIPNTGHYNIGGLNVLYSPSSQDLHLNAPNVGGGHHLYIEIGGVKMARFDTSGHLELLGTLTQNGTP